ncbi:DUF3597 domain-containing protein [Roseixanthobacter pseudopolyaromaticivorans]|uniref:DUF3597 domain-containing protein n=1 Tax=Xanthobacteraceae TaxID=335928 RepID=UPI00372782BE
MSIFGKIVSAIFGHGAQAGTVAPANAPSPGGTSGGAAPPVPGATPAAPQASAVDVEAVLSGLAAKNSEKLDWRHSIVDLMKLLDLDSSLTARKELAHELNYSGDTGDSATMNIWLHKQVMTKLAENGGKVPEDLKH